MMHTMTRLLLVLAVMFTCTSSWAAVPEALNYSGFLSTDTGPAVGPVNVLFELYTAETDGSMVWSEQHDAVALDEGYFDLRLGETHTLLPVMDGTAYWLQVSVDGELLLPRSAVVSVPYALQAGDAQRVGGLEVTELVGSSSANALPYENTGSGLAATDVQGALDELQAALAAQQAALDAQQASIDALTAENTALRGELSIAQLNITGLNNSMTAIESKTASMTADATNVYFDGVNVNIRNGLNNTATMNGEGNLIVGYNEKETFTVATTGSHNIIVGKVIGYSSYGGIVTGYKNTQGAKYASVIGGQQNTASGDNSVVTGGLVNTASGNYSSVSGGGGNLASADGTSISGGSSNVASIVYASVSGGVNNHASGDYSSVSGGRSNTASGANASVSGGNSNIASGQYSSVSGGTGNTAVGNYSVVSGGQTRSAAGALDWVAGTLFETN